MKRVLLSILLSICMFVISIPCWAKDKSISDLSIIDLGEDTVDSSVYDLIIADECELKKAFIISDGFREPVFLKTSNLDLNDVLTAYEIKICGGTEDLKVQEDLEFAGYLIYAQGNSVVSWYKEKEVSDQALTDAIATEILNFDQGTSVEPCAVTWNPKDSYSTKVTYTEATVGVSGVLYSSSKSKYGGQQFVVEVTPTASTAYMTYRTVSVQPKISITNGTVSDYWPDVRSSYSSSITIAFPWSVSITFDTEASVNVTKPSGGVGDTHMTWKYAPSSATKDIIKTKSGVTFNSNTATLKTTVRYDVTLYKLDNTTGTNSTRTVNYSTTFSS